MIILLVHVCVFDCNQSESFLLAFTQSSKVLLCNKCPSRWFHLFFSILSKWNISLLFRHTVFLCEYIQNTWSIIKTFEMNNLMYFTRRNFKRLQLENCIQRTAQWRIPLYTPSHSVYMCLYKVKRKTTNGWVYECMVRQNLIGFPGQCASLNFLPRN